MAKRQQKDWIIDEWDDSLDVHTASQSDPFGIPKTLQGNNNDEWDDIPSEWQTNLHSSSPVRQISKNKLIIILSSVAAVCVFIAVILSLSGAFSSKPPVFTVLPSTPPTTLPTVLPSTEVPQTPQITRFITNTPDPTPSPSPVPTASPSPTPEPVPESAVLNNPWYGPELRYYYQFLTEREKQIFDDVYTAAINYQSHAVTAFFDSVEINHVLYVLRHDCPELFCLTNYCEYSVNSVNLSYRMNQDEYNRICSSIRSQFSSISSSFPINADDFEKQLVIYRYIIDHCEYLAAEDDSTACADACLYQGKSQCSGYADALSLALRTFGIQSLIANSDDHAWNLVNIDGQWYNCDATWDDTIRIPYDPSQDEYNAWMNLPERLYAADSSHIPNIEPGFPLPDATSLEASYVKRKASYIPPGKTNIAGSIDSCLKQADQAGKQHVLIMLDDQSYVDNWDSIREKLYHTYNNYGWSFYPPVEAHRCIYAVKSE